MSQVLKETIGEALASLHNWHKGLRPEVKKRWGLKVSEETVDGNKVSVTVTLIDNE